MKTFSSLNPAGLAEEIVTTSVSCVEVAYWQDGELVTVQVYGKEATLTSSVLPGLTIDVGPVFRPWQEG